ncbi:hypothetical protein J3R83DRAFT_8300 [Lanmaoa asiatica]|nr:hypothetical protein J3R83DRAFT_8300 [Lanmaoa asiatica]
MADKLNVSLEPHLRDALAALLQILPEETSQQLTPRLSSETNATVVPVIPYELILNISRWCQTTDGKATLQACSPPLDPQSYTMVSLLRWYPHVARKAFSSLRSQRSRRGPTSADKG